MSQQSEAEVLSIEFPEPDSEFTDKYINTRGATLNYTVWKISREVYCADKNSPGLI